MIFSKALFLWIISWRSKFLICIFHQDNETKKRVLVVKKKQLSSRPAGHRYKVTLEVDTDQTRGRDYAISPKKNWHISLKKKTKQKEICNYLFGLRKKSDHSDCIHFIYCECCPLTEEFLWIICASFQCNTSLGFLNFCHTSLDSIAVSLFTNIGEWQCYCYIYTNSPGFQSWKIDWGCVPIPIYAGHEGLLQKRFSIKSPNSSSCANAWVKRSVLEKLKKQMSWAKTFFYLGRE